MDISKLVEREKEIAAVRMQKAFAGIEKYLDSEYRYFVLRFLWSTENVLDGAFGNFALYNPIQVYNGREIRCGYGPRWGSSAPERMEFLAFFIGHEMEDDGEPCIAYWRWNHEGTEDNKKVLCAPDHSDAHPFLDTSSEIHGWSDGKPVYPCVRAISQVVEVLDFWEKERKECVRMHQEEGCCLPEAERVRQFGKPTGCCLEKVDPETLHLRLFLLENNLTPTLPEK